MTTKLLYILASIALFVLVPLGAAVSEPRGEFKINPAQKAIINLQAGSYEFAVCQGPMLECTNISLRTDTNTIVVSHLGDAPYRHIIGTWQTQPMRVKIDAGATPTDIQAAMSVLACAMLSRADADKMCIRK